MTTTATPTSRRAPDEENQTFVILEPAIQVAPRPRKGMIPPEEFFEHRALTSLLPVIADTGPQKEEYMSRQLPEKPNLEYLKKASQRTAAQYAAGQTGGCATCAGQ